MGERVLKDLHRGDEVYWTDPDNGVSSGYYTVLEVHAPSGEPIDEDTIVVLLNASGGIAEVLIHELS